MSAGDPTPLPRELHLVLPAGTFSSRPRRLSASVLVVGEGYTRAFQRRFGTHSDDAVEYGPDADLPDERFEQPPTAVLPIEAADDQPVGWHVWTSLSGISARAADAGNATLTLGWPDGPRPTIAAPAVETATHELVLYVLAPAGGQTQVYECRFPAPPKPKRKSAPGAPTATLVCTLPGTPSGRAALCVVQATGEARLVCPFATADGLSLTHVVARDGHAQPTATLPLAGAQTIPGVAPSAFVDSDGDTVLAMLTLGSALDPRVCCARVRGAELAGVEHRRWAPLGFRPKTAAIAFSSIAGERPDYRFALLTDDDALYLGGSDVALSLTTIEGQPLTPLAWTVTRDVVNVAVRSDRGPLLASARPTALASPAPREGSSGWLSPFPLLTEDLLATPTTGLSVSAPETVERSRGWRLSLVVSQRGSADDLDRLTLEERGFLVLALDGAGSAQVSPIMPAACAPELALRLMGEDPDPARTEPAARVAHLDATHRLTLPPSATTGTLFLVLADQRSDGRRLALSELAPDVAERASRFAGPEIVLQPAPRLLDGVEPLRAPPTGIALSVERFAVRSPGAKLVLRGAFRLPIDAARPSDVVHVTLVASGAAHPVPRALSVAVETRTYASHRAGDLAIDLLTTALCDVPDTWFLHAFVAGHASAPAVTTIVQSAD